MRRWYVLACVLGALAPASARAATFTVTSDADAAGDCSAGSPACTLRQAVSDANAAADRDDIRFDLPAGRRKIVLAAPLSFTHEVTLVGPAVVPPVILNGGLQDVVRFDAGSSGELRGVVVDGEALTGVRVAAGAGPVTIAGNEIGLDDDGQAVDGGFHRAAVALEGDGNVLIGNTLAAADADAAAAGILVNGIGNRIAGNTVGLARGGATPLDPAGRSPGVVVGCAADGTQIQGNVVAATLVALRAGGACVTSGLLADGNRIGTVAPNQAGIALSGSLPNATISANTIVNSRAGPGIKVGDAGAGVRITRNSISGNAGGIDLPGGANDPGDTDGTQNFPAVAAATSDGAATLSLTSKPNRDFALEVFASPACDLSGFGEGATYLDTVHVHTDGAGFARVGAALPARPAGTVLTATATDAVTRDTSEFSACAAVAQAPPPPPAVTPSATPAPAPVLGKSVAVTPVTGPVRIKRPRAPRFVPLTAGELIPVGSTVDAQAPDPQRCDGTTVRSRRIA